MPSETQQYVHENATLKQSGIGEFHQELFAARVSDTRSNLWLYGERRAEKQ
jgi:hypothetical protein